MLENAGDPMEMSVAVYFCLLLIKVAFAFKSV